MDIISVLATVILFTTVTTLVVALATYVAYKMRERRKPMVKAPAELGQGEFTPIFLEPYGADPTTRAPSLER